MTRKKNRSALREYVDAGTPERAQHGDTQERTVLNEFGRAVGRGRRATSPIERVGLTRDLLIAAEAFRRDYELAVWGVRDVENPDAPPIRSNLPPTSLPDAVIDAGRRVQAARDAMGPCAEVVVAVVCEEVPLTVLGEQTGQNRQELAGVLKIGIAALARWQERRPSRRVARAAETTPLTLNL